MNALRTAKRVAILLTLAFGVANALLFGIRRPWATDPMGTGDAAWRTLPEERRRQMLDLLKPGQVASDPAALLAARRFAALDPICQNRLRQLHRLYALTVAAQPLSWWRRFMQADPRLRAIWVERALRDGDPALLNQVEALYSHP